MHHIHGIMQHLSLCNRIMHLAYCRLIRTYWWFWTVIGGQSVSCTLNTSYFVGNSFWPRSKHSLRYVLLVSGLLWWLGDKESRCRCWRCGRCGFNPWVRKITWRRKWQPTPEFLPGKSHGRRSLVGYRPRGHKESDMTERLHFTSL